MSFLKSSANSSTTKRVQSLTTQFFTQVIKLEQEISNKTYTAETLDELTQFYAQCVEYYDSIQDNIASYFIYKIQDILATKKSLKLLIQENAKALNNSHASELNRSRDQSSQQEEPGSAGLSSGQNNSFLSGNNNNSQYKVTVSSPNLDTEHDVITEAHEESSDEEEAAAKYNKRRVTKMPANLNMRDSISTLKNKKQKYFSLELKMRNEKANVKQNLNDVLENFGGSSKDNDSVVKGDISSQKKRMQEKLARKKKDNLANYTQNMTGFLRSENFDDNKNMESFLKGLDDEESFLPPSSNNFEGNAFTNSNIQDLTPMKQKNLTVQNGGENGENVAFTFSPEKSRVDTENIEGGSDKNQEEGEMIFKEEEEQPEAIPVANEAEEVTQSEETASPGFENENAIGEKGLESAQQQQEEAVVEEANEKKAEEVQERQEENVVAVVAAVESQ